MITPQKSPAALFLDEEACPTMRNTNEEQTHAPEAELSSKFYGNTPHGKDSPNLSQRSLLGIEKELKSLALNQTEHKASKAERSNLTAVSVLDCD